MMIRFGLTARFLAIGGSMLLACWIVLIAFYYWSSDLTRTAANPRPEQLAGIADLLDDADGRERDIILRALQSATLEVRIVQSAPPPYAGADTGSRPAFAAYRDLLGDRLLAIRATPRPDSALGQRLFPRAAEVIEFWIRLRGGETLMVEARTPFIVTLSGLPAGLGAGLLGTLFACAAFVLLHREIRPLTRLAAAVDRIDPAGDPIHLPAIRSSTPEIGALIRAFDRLQTRLQTMMRSRFAMIGGIQHDVRSFATRLRLRVEHLPDARERERAAQDIANMIELLDNALLTARAGVGALDEELLDLALLVQTEVTDLKAAGSQVQLESGPAGAEAWVIGDRLALRRVLGNVIDNAVKFGERARVTLSSDGKQVSIHVDDDGPGFLPEHRDILLEPFVRAEPSRARATGGAGLGLAVARGLVEAHGGGITLGANGTGGGRVTLTLPLFAPAPPSDDL